MVKPIQSLLLLCYVLIILIVVSFFFPNNNQLSIIAPTINQKGDTIDDGFSLKFFSFKEIFIKDTLGKVNDISETVALAEKLRNLEKSKILSKTDSLNLPDSLKHTSTDTLPVLDVAKIQQLLSDKYQIQFPENNPTVLNNFFKALNFLKQDSTLIRILHYGDSQIEGDRITSQVRNNFQLQFGGCGVGLVPVFDAVQKSTIFRKKSPYWHNYLVFGGKYDKKNPANYGLMGSYFSYTPTPIKDKVDSIKSNLPILPDSLLKKEIANKPLLSAWFEYEKGWKKHAQMIEAKQVSLLYGNVYTPNLIQITTPTDTLATFLLKPSKGLQVKTFPLKTDFDKVKIVIKGEKSPQMYGMAFDGKKGVAVDNIGFRGSSGTEFTRMDMKAFAEEIKKMNVKLLILQFGVNVAAGKQLSTYDYYEKMYSKQLAALRAAVPNVSILIVSLSDMAYKENGVLTSRPSIEKVRDAQRNAAFENGCAFWDLYEAMGGRNSMVSWVEAKPALAQNDYTHFNAEGAELVGEMLYNALILAYAKYNKLIQ